VSHNAVPDRKEHLMSEQAGAKRPNILFLMTDQQRFDTIAALGNAHIVTPNLDRLARRAVSFTNAYTTCPVCVAARYTIRTGCEPPTTRIFSNRRSAPVAGQADTVEARCGPYLVKAMAHLGYRTFGVGKFHTQPWDEELGYQVHLHSEELYGTADQRRRDDFAAWIAREWPQFDYVEALMGERTEMYYMPQVSPLPPEATVEWWAADRAVEQIAGHGQDARGTHGQDVHAAPFFGFVSFVGPHPPFAPPVPFNRMYDPDRMPNPVVGDPAGDHKDPFLPASNHAMYADEISPHRARCLKARYYGEITYIDHCVGRILDALDAAGLADNTLVAFLADHGDHLGDHNAWQKESFFEGACHVPLLVSWPGRLPADTRRDELVCLTDLFGLATAAAGAPDLREGIDLLGMLDGRAAPRETLIGLYGEPGTHHFKAMVRRGQWKYIHIANGGREQLFDLGEDPAELRDLADELRDVACELRALAAAACDTPGARDALDGGDLRAFALQQAWQPQRCRQFDRSRGVSDFPADPADVLAEFRRRMA